MAIKKRTRIPAAEEAAPKPTKLVIVAKPKTPLPEEKGYVESIYGENPDPMNVMRLGQVASQLGHADADEYLTITDRVALMRTPYDVRNTQEVRYRGRVKNRGTGITAMCVQCSGGRKAVTECASTECPLWAFRFGTDPFYGRGKK